MSGDTEALVRAAWERGDFDAATTALLRGYGPEILGFLTARLHDGDLARDAFAWLSEQAWRGLPRFEWRSSVRVWAWVLARRAAVRVARNAHRGRAAVPLSQAGTVAELIAQARSPTPTFLRTDTKDRVRRLRERLSVEDHTLLVLRVDKKFAWREVALVMAEGEGAPLGEDALSREAARLRKRFEAVKEKLRELARAEGLL